MTNIIPNGEKIETISSEVRNETRVFIFPTHIIYIGLEFLAIPIKQVKEIKKGISKIILICK
jgi:hypothetical protein